MNNTNTRTVVGTWQSADKSTQISLYKGRKDTKQQSYNENTAKYYGRIISSNNSLSKNKKVLINFTAVGLDYLRDGQAFHYTNGQMYDAYVRLLPNGTLKVRLYIQKTIIGHTDIWTKIITEK